MCGAARASTDTVHVLVAFGRVLSKVDAGTKHAADVGVALVEAFVNDGVDEGRTWRKRHSVTATAAATATHTSNI